MLRETLTVPAAKNVSADFARACMRAAAEFYPPVIEEFEGILEAGGFDREAMTAYYFARLESQVGCTMLAVTPAAGARAEGPVVGRNYDWATGDLRWCRLERCAAGPRGRRRVGYSHHWAGCADLLNDAGLYVAIASLPPAQARAPGVQWNIVTEMISETCATVAEAAEACAGVRHLRSMSYLLADAAGAAGVVEATPDEVRLREATAEGGCAFVVAANAPQGGRVLRNWNDEPKSAEGLAEAPPHYRGGAVGRAERRIRQAQTLLKELLARNAGRRPSVEQIQRILSDHKAPICVGDHADADGAPWGTIWSGICEPARGELLIAPGLPCRHAYQTFRIG